MINKKRILGLTVFIAVASLVLIVKFYNAPCLPPDKPSSLSENVKWFGDCDGGNWIELININKQEEIIRLKIYRDYDGTLEMDANFKIDGCEFNYVNESNWSEKMVGYLNESILLIGIKDCFLKPVYPAFGGEEWELIKEKGNVPN